MMAELHFFQNLCSHTINSTTVSFWCTGPNLHMVYTSPTINLYQLKNCKTPLCWQGSGLSQQGVEMLWMHCTVGRTRRAGGTAVDVKHALMTPLEQQDASCSQSYCRQNVYAKVCKSMARLLYPQNTWDFFLRRQSSCGIETNQSPGLLRCKFITLPGYETLLTNAYVISISDGSVY